MHKLIQDSDISSVFSYTDMNENITLNVIFDGVNYIFRGGVAGNYKLLKSMTSYEKLKEHWENYVAYNKESGQGV